MLFTQIGFDDDEYVNLLAKFIGHAEHLQNNPAAGLIPREKLIADEIVAYLGTDLPGVTIRVHAYDKDGLRPNLIIRYRHPDVDTRGHTIAFMGSHMDVVPASRAEWHVDPFVLTKDAQQGDYFLYGRGTTDCLGHVALLAVMLKRLAQHAIKLSHEIALVFIADEEVGSADVGVFRLYQDHLLNDFKGGAIYWLDTATDDGLFGPRVGTGGIGRWSITVVGRGGHSGYPELCINPISVATSLISYMNDRFRDDFQHGDAATYAKAFLYPTCSTCKCTSFRSQSPGKTIIPEQCEIGGDVRFTPDVSAQKIKEALPRYVDEFNQKIVRGEIVASGANGGNYILVDKSGQQQAPIIEFTWDSEVFGQPFVADINSPAYDHILAAMKEVRGVAQPFSALGSLPLIAELSCEGFSLVPIGFGRQKQYHAANEFCVLSEMRDGYRVMVSAIERHCRAIQA